MPRTQAEFDLVKAWILKRFATHVAEAHAAALIAHIFGSPAGSVVAALLEAKELAHLARTVKKLSGALGPGGKHEYADITADLLEFIFSQE